MALQNQTAAQRLALANALDRASAQVRENIYRTPVNYPADVADALGDLNTLLDATIAA